MLCGDLFDVLEEGDSGPESHEEWMLLHASESGGYCKIVALFPARDTWCDAP
jgi:hypothetical protein